MYPDMTDLKNFVLFIVYRLPAPVFLGFCGSAGKEPACNAGDLGLIPGLGRSPGERKGYPLQYSGLENSIGCIIHGVAKTWRRLSDLHFDVLFISCCPHSREKETYQCAKILNGN